MLTSAGMIIGCFEERPHVARGVAIVATLAADRQMHNVRLRITERRQQLADVGNEQRVDPVKAIVRAVEASLFAEQFAQAMKSAAARVLHVDNHKGARSCVEDNGSRKAFNVV